MEVHCMIRLCRDYLEELNKLIDQGDLPDDIELVSIENEREFMSDILADLNEALYPSDQRIINKKIKTSRILVGAYETLFMLRSMINDELFPEHIELPFIEHHLDFLNDIICDFEEIPEITVQASCVNFLKDVKGKERKLLLSFYNTMVCNETVREA